MSALTTLEGVTSSGRAFEFAGSASAGPGSGGSVVADISLPAIRAKCPTHGVQRFEWWPEDRSWLCVECNICHTSNGICSCKVAVVVREFIDRDGADHVWWRKKNGPMIDYEPVEVLHIVERDLERKNGCSPT